MVVFVLYLGSSRSQIVTFSIIDVNIALLISGNKGRFEKRMKYPARVPKNGTNRQGIYPKTTGAEGNQQLFCRFWLNKMWAFRICQVTTENASKSCDQ